MRSLAVAEQDLGQLLSLQDDPACLVHLQAHYDLMDRIGDAVGAARAASFIGNAYLHVSSLRDLDKAEQWFERDLDLTPERDVIGRAATLGSLGSVAYSRFLDARDQAGASSNVLLGHLRTALDWLQQSIAITPDDHCDYLGNSHMLVGNLYAELHDVPLALHHYQQAVQYREACSDVYGAGGVRHNIALLLRAADRPETHSITPAQPLLITMPSALAPRRKSVGPRTSSKN